MPLRRRGKPSRSVSAAVQPVASPLPAQVVAHARVSRSLLYAAFAQATGTTVRKAIEDARLKIVLRNLSRKDLSIERISRLVGYQNVQRLKYVFKACFGYSMSDYRLRRCPRGVGPSSRAR